MPQVSFAYHILIVEDENRQNHVAWLWHFGLTKQSTP